MVSCNQKNFNMADVCFSKPEVVISYSQLWIKIRRRIFFSFLRSWPYFLSSYCILGFDNGDFRIVSYTRLQLCSYSGPVQYYIRSQYLTVPCRSDHRVANIFLCHGFEVREIKSQNNLMYVKLTRIS